MKWILSLICLLAPALTWGAVLPVVNVQVTPNKGDLKTAFVIDARLSENVNGLNTGLQFRFKPSRNDAFSGWNSNTRFTFYPQKTGNYEATIQVRDRYGAINTSYAFYRVVEESFRKVRLTVSTTTPAPGEAVELQAIITSANQREKDQAKVRWDFTSDGHFDTSFSLSKTAFHVYTGGQTTPTAQVLFPNGEIVSVRGFEVVGESYRSRTPAARGPKIISKPISPKNPVVTVSPGVEVFNENTIFSFDASKTQVSGWLEWSIDGVKFVENKKKIQHKFLSPGVHQVRVRNCINRSQPQCAETKIEVNIKAEPTDVLLDFLMYNQTDKARYTSRHGFLAVTEGDRVRFSAQILNNFNTNQKWQCRWDFDGDGVWDTPFTGSVSAEHTYDRTGTFPVKLQIRSLRDSEKLEPITKTKTVIVRENKAPKGRIWFKKMTNYSGEKVFFEAILGDRNSDNNVEIRVDSDGDGVWDSDFRKIRSWWWQYDMPGKYDVVMQVRDPQKKVYQTKRTINILPPLRPAIKVTVSHREQLVGQTINFDASKSSGQNLYYEWKIIGDPYVWGYGPRTNFRFDKPGNYVICLRITDQAGTEQEVNIPVKVVTAESQKTTQETPSTTKTASDISTSDMRFMGLNVPGGVDLSPKTDPFAVTSGYTPTPTPVLTGMRPGW